MGLKLRQGIAKMLNEPGALIYRNITVVKKTCPLNFVFGSYDAKKYTLM